MTETTFQMRVVFLEWNNGERTCRCGPYRDRKEALKFAVKNSLPRPDLVDGVWDYPERLRGKL